MMPAPGAEGRCTRSSTVTASRPEASQVQSRCQPADPPPTTVTDRWKSRRPDPLTLTTAPSVVESANGWSPTAPPATGQVFRSSNLLITRHNLSLPQGRAAASISAESAKPYDIQQDVYRTSYLGHDERAGNASSKVDSKMWLL